MVNKYIMLDFDDPRIKDLADVLNNKTCKKILEYLAENEASETEIARDLKLPANTINYNIKKLLDAGLVEKAKDFFWSVKGKKVLKYQVANKKIVISPKNSQAAKNLLISGLLVGVGAFFIKMYYGSKNIVDESLMRGEFSIANDISSVGMKVADSASHSPDFGIWFLFGGLIGLIIYAILNYRRL